MYCYALQSRCAEQFIFLDTYTYIYIYIYIFFLGGAGGVICNFCHACLSFHTYEGSVPMFIPMLFRLKRVCVFVQLQCRQPYLSAAPEAHLPTNIYHIFSSFADGGCMALS